MRFIDSHFHSQFTLEKGVNVFSFYDNSPANGFLGGIDIGCTHDDLPSRKQSLEKYPQILLAAAMGPWEAGASESKGTDPDFDDIPAGDSDFQLDAERDFDADLL